MADAWTLIGRSSSHYTRVVRIAAEEIGTIYRLEPIHDFTTESPAVFGGNPALKMPVLRRDKLVVYGTLNICRTLANERGAHDLFFWPEMARSVALMNAHELLAHAMAAEVDIVMHEYVARRPADAVSRKRRKSLLNCLRWLDQNLEELRTELPPNQLSIFEISLYCLVTHLPFRNPTDLSGAPTLVQFERSFGERRSTQATPYQFDQQ
jgi:glutathione S-transferase